MRRNQNKFIFDMLDSCRFLLEVTQNENVDRYKMDRLFRSAVERELHIIGEAMMQLKGLSPEAAARFTEHNRIIGFRYVLVHGYHDLDPDLVWLVVTEKLSVLRGELETALAEDPP